MGNRLDSFTPSSQMFRSPTLSDDSQIMRRSASFGACASFLTFCVPAAWCRPLSSHSMKAKTSRRFDGLVLAENALLAANVK